MQPLAPPIKDLAVILGVASLVTLSELGVIFLISSLGLDFSFHKLKRVGTPAIVTGALEVLVVLLIGFILGKIFG